MKESDHMFGFFAERKVLLDIKVVIFTLIPFLSSYFPFDQGIFVAGSEKGYTEGNCHRDFEEECSATWEFYT